MKVNFVADGNVLKFNMKDERAYVAALRRNVDDMFMSIALVTVH